MNIWLQELAVLAAGGDQNVDAPPTLDLREHLVNENNSQRPEQLVFSLVYQPPSDFPVGALLRNAASASYLLYAQKLCIQCPILNTY